jgi:hypothetical protein
MKGGTMEELERLKEKFNRIPQEVSTKISDWRGKC